MKIKELVRKAHATAVEKGFHNKPRTFGDVIALLHTEISEAYEEFRHGHLQTETYYETDEQGNRKPCGIPSELADLVIRIGDACGEYGIDLEEILEEKMVYNATRPYRHGNKVI